MKKLSPFVILFSVMALSVSAQKKLYLSQNPVWVEWEDTAYIHPVPVEHASQPAVQLLNETKIDYRVEGVDIVKHTTRHVIMKVLDRRGIDRYDLLYIPLERGTKVTKIDARTVAPSGRITKINRQRILIAADHSMVIIPLEGIEKNAEIEYLVKDVNACDYFGRVEFQTDIPVAKTRFLLSYPKNMHVEGISYNNFPVLKEEMAHGRRQYKIEVDNIAPLLKEDEGFYELNTKSFEYRISSYTPNDGLEVLKLNSYDSLASKIYRENYNISEKERSVVNSFLTELGVHPASDEAVNIAKIEDGIKKKITVYPFVSYEERKEITAQKDLRSMSVYAAGYDSRKDVLDSILTKKAASYKGYIKLFAACLTQAGIKHEIGWAWDRSEYRPNTQLESWLGLDYTLIYFPNQKKFLAPTSKYLRYPVIPSELAASKGVFCTIPARGGLTGRMHRVRYITPLPAESTRKDVSASISFTRKMEPTATVSNEWYGYSGTDIRSALPFIRPENMKKFVAENLDFINDRSDILTYSFSNEKETSYNSNKPLSLYTTINASSLVDKAGSRYLIKVGKVIGAQNNLYEEKKRVMPVDLTYPHSAVHTITINIPKGYKIVNPESAALNAEYLNGEVETVINFNSDYKLIKDYKNGDKLIITVRESYSQLHFPLFEYERFRKVWNTAADFNNVVLILARK